jgi:large exoprotein involved in heme utilization and adhesion
MKDNAIISSEAENAGGGIIEITSKEDMALLNAKITTSVKQGSLNGGDIFLSSKMSILNKSQIIANAYEGTGGIITINSDHLIRSADSIIDASSQLGINGTVNILSPEQDFSRGLNTLPSTFMDATQWLNHPCDQRMGDISSLMIIKRDALPQLPQKQMHKTSLM